MIQYMPFTYIPEDLAKRLTKAFGQLAVWQPLESLAPVHMRTMAVEGRLQWRLPSGLDPVQLSRAAQSFSQWAELHQGKVGDLSTFFKAGQGGGAQESSTQQIRSQIRHWGDAGAAATDVALFQAALFLCLAHNYDQQQDALARELGSVRHLETQFGKILGEGDDPNASIGPTLSPAGDGVIADPGLFMTERRLHAWARLAATQIDPGGVYITTSLAVWEYFQAHFDDMSLASILPPDGEHAVKPRSPDELVSWLSALTKAEDPKTLITASGMAGCRAEGGADMTLAVLVGCTPAMFFNRILEVSDERVPAAKIGSHTVLGYVR